MWKWSMNEHRRTKERWDYRKLHNTGERIRKIEDSSEDQNSEDGIPEDYSPDKEDNYRSVDERTKKKRIMGDPTQLAAEEMTISEDIEDFLDENIVKEMGNNVDDYDFVNKRVEELRSRYRGKHNQLKSVLKDDEYNDKYGDTYVNKLDEIKEYVRQLKAKRNL